LQHYRGFEIEEPVLIVVILGICLKRNGKFPVKIKGRDFGEIFITILKDFFTLFGTSCYVETSYSTEGRFTSEPNNGENGSLAGSLTGSNNPA